MFGILYLFWLNIEFRDEKERNLRNFIEIIEMIIELMLSIDEDKLGPLEKYEPRKAYEAYIHPSSNGSLGHNGWRDWFNEREYYACKTYISTIQSLIKQIAFLWIEMGSSKEYIIKSYKDEDGKFSLD